AQPRDAANQRARGRREAPGPLLPQRPHAREGGARAGPLQSRFSVYTRPPPRVTEPDLLRSYAPPPSRYDEMVDDALRPRPHWQAFLAHLSGLSTDTLRERTQFVHDANASDGVSYN